jgi:hypothetical protein
MNVIYHGRRWNLISAIEYVSGIHQGCDFVMGLGARQVHW